MKNYADSTGRLLSADHHRRLRGSIPASQSGASASTLSADHHRRLRGSRNFSHLWDERGYALSADHHRRLRGSKERDAARAELANSPPITIGGSVEAGGRAPGTC